MLDKCVNKLLNLFSVEVQDGSCIICRGEIEEKDIVCEYCTRRYGVRNEEANSSIIVIM